MPLPLAPIIAKFGLSALAFTIPWRMWLVIGLVTALGLFIWRFQYLSNAVKNYKAAVEVQQNRVDGNRRLVEELSNNDDQIMYDQMRRAEDAADNAKNWLRQQDPEIIKKGYAPQGYVGKLNEVR